MAINENDSRVRRTKKLIRKGFTDLAKEKSIEKITVKELTDRIDINRGTFYLHYTDIEDLAESIQNEIYSGFCQILSSVTVERIKQEPGEILFEFCCFLKQNSDVCSALILSEQTYKFAEEAGKRLCEKCYELLVLTYPNMNTDKYDLICEYFIYGGIGLVRAWLKYYPEKPPRQISELWLCLAMSGVKGIIESETKERVRK